MWSARQTWKMGRRAAGFLGGLLATILLVAAPAAAQFVEPINLSNTSAVNSGRPAIAVNEVNGTPYVFAVWEEGINGQTSIFFARSQPGLASCGGLKFGRRDIPVVPGSTPASMPAVAASNTSNSGSVFVVWQASSDVWMSRSTDNGETFLSPVNLSRDASPSNSPTVAADGSGVFVAWGDGSTGQILFRKSLDYGATFAPGLSSPAANLSQTPFTHVSQVASVAAGGGNVFLAWEERQRFGLIVPSRIRYKKFAQSADLATVAGLAPLFLSNGLFRAFSPNLAYGDGALSVAFSTFDAVYHRSWSNVTDFSPPLDLAPENLSNTIPLRSNARGARRNDSAMVAWAQSLGDSTDVRHWQMGSTNGPEPVLTTAARRASPAAAIDSNGRLLVAWQGRETADLPNDEIYVSYKGGTGGDGPNAIVEMTPQTLNAKTMYQGQGVFTLRIRFMDGSAVGYPTSLAVNGNPAVTPVRSSLVDTDGVNGPDMLELKIKREDLQFEETTLRAAEGNGNYPVKVKAKGNMTGGLCFSGEAEVRIIHQ